MSPGGAALFLTPAADRFFLVPHGRELAPGEFLVVAVTGEERRVDAGDLAPLEVARGEAEAHLRGEAERAMANVADTLGRALGIAGAAPPDMRRVAERLGLSQRDLERDPKAAGAALGGLAEDMQAISALVASGESADLDAARARLAARGIDLGDTLDELPRQLEALRRLDQQDVARAAATGLRALADAIEGTDEEQLGRRIDELIARLEREVGPYLGRDPERIRRERQEEYRVDAGSAIADSLREAGITPLNDPRDQKS